MVRDTLRDQHAKERELARLKEQQPDILFVCLDDGRARKARAPSRAGARTSQATMLHTICALALEQLKAGRQLILYGAEHQSSLWGDLSRRNNPGSEPDHPLMPLKELVDKKKLYNVAVRMCRYKVVGEFTKTPSNRVIRIISDHAFKEDWKCTCNKLGSPGDAHVEDRSPGITNIHR